MGKKALSEEEAAKKPQSAGVGVRKAQSSRQLLPKKAPSAQTLLRLRSQSDEPTVHLAPWIGMGNALRLFKEQVRLKRLNLLQKAQGVNLPSPEVPIEAYAESQQSLMYV